MSADPVAPPSDGVFTVGRRGYDPQQVDAHLRRLDAEIRILVADRDAAADQATQLGRELDEARQRADRLRAQVRTMASRPSDVQGMSERMRTMLRLAEDEVAEMLRRADAEAARRLGEIDARAEEVVGAARAEAAAVLDAARAQAQTTVEAAARHLAEVDAECTAERAAVANERAAAAQAIAQVTEAADRERARVWAESEARRATVEEDFRIAMDQRRDEALAELHAERARVAEATRHARDEAARQCRAELAAAEETGRRIVAEARARADELDELRERIAVQLRGAHRELFETLSALAPGSEPPVRARAAIVGPDAVDDPEAGEALPAPDAPAALPAGTGHPDADDQSGPARRQNARRRRRRPATGATRR